MATTTTTTTLHNVDLRNHHLEKDPCIINTVSFHSDDTSSSDVDDESQLQEHHHEKPKSEHYELITHDHHHHDYHPLRTQITSQTNDFILTHWSFSSSSSSTSSSSSLTAQTSASSSATSYLTSDLPGLACKIFPCALDDRIHLLARLFSVVFLLGEEIDSLVNHHENDDERDEREVDDEGVRKEIIQFLKESFNGVDGRRRERKVDREEEEECEEEEEEEFPLVWMLNHVLDEMASHAYLLVMGEVQEAIWRFLGIAGSQRRGEKDDDDDALLRFRKKFVDAGMWLPLYRFATGGMVDEEEFGFGGVEMVGWSGVVGGGDV